MDSRLSTCSRPRLRILASSGSAWIASNNYTLPGQGQDGQGLSP